ncbi:MAG: bifunctional histidinol-phosphatase/imidazoleglycerol-phosphate dehydratase HisB [Bacteroidales bacterium]
MASSFPPNTDQQAVPAKRLLFIDRDGTLILEPPETFQVDSLELLEFLPGVFRNLSLIAGKLDYEIVMVTNQDGLGTKVYPQESFDLVQNRVLRYLQNEGISFMDIHVDKSFPHEGLDTRKPGVGMLKKYFDREYDLPNSYVIGDRLTDVELAANLGAKAILIAGPEMQKEIADRNLASVCALISPDWDHITDFLFLQDRTAEVKRVTSETDIYIRLKLDGAGNAEINTGLGFFDHMLGQIARHAGCDLEIRVKGDLEVDEHHTVEDTALALGEAFNRTLGNKQGLERYGFSLPMDDASAQVLIDFGGRPWLAWNAEFKREKVGDLPTELFSHFFKSFSDAARCNLNIRCEGINEHHKIESVFKAFARAIKMAIRRDRLNQSLPSTKGIL